jgi:hypothetical protein
MGIVLISQESTFEVTNSAVICNQDLSVDTVIMSVSRIIVLVWLYSWSLIFRWCPIYSPYSKWIFLPMPLKSSSILAMTNILHVVYTFLQIQECKCSSSLTDGTLMSKSADNIWYDGYAINDKPESITQFMRKNVWCRATVWWNNSWISRTISIKDLLVLPVISKNEYRLFASKDNIYIDDLTNSSFSVSKKWARW